MTEQLLLKETALLPQNALQPKCLVKNLDDSYQIIINLKGAEESRMHAFLGNDHSKMYVVGKADLDDSTARFLWIFALPVDSLKQQITLDRKNDLFLIEIPRAKPLRHKSNGQTSLQMAV